MLWSDSRDVIATFDELGSTAKTRIPVSGQKTTAQRTQQAGRGRRHHKRTASEYSLHEKPRSVATDTGSRKAHLYFPGVTCVLQLLKTTDPTVGSWICAFFSSRAVAVRARYWTRMNRQVARAIAPGSWRERIGSISNRHSMDGGDTTVRV
jgi:hypothetical protein